ncbi:MAG: radical SAM protein [Ignavibacteriales bacterium]
MQELLIDQKNLYRLPWTLPDNAISWLEPTALCNLTCDGCYRENAANSHKTMDEIKQELDVFMQYRITDGISIAGGDPLLHPDIVEIVREIAKRKIKPIINTNGLALTKEKLIELKKAGVFGFTFHIDSKQNRPKWKDKNEIELNELRLMYAKMLDDIGGISCSFNATVYEDTLQYVPEMVEWAAEHIDIVHVMVFIAYRQIVPKLPMDWYAGGEKVDMGSFWYATDTDRRVDILSTDILKKIQERFPDYYPCGYLNGTEKADSYKWLLTIRVGNKKKIMGYMGQKFIELVQTQYHLWRGKYLAYASPAFTRLGRSILFMWLFDKKAKMAVIRYFASIIKNPITLFRRLHFQSVMIIQPVDFMEDGGQNMCDGCPDITVWNGKLVWSCRLEEPKKFGCFVRTVPRKDGSD